MRQFQLGKSRTSSPSSGSDSTVVPATGLTPASLGSQLRSGQGNHQPVRGRPQQQPPWPWGALDGHPSDRCIPTGQRREQDAKEKQTRGTL